MVQVLPTISYGDAVGNDAMAIQKIIHEMGYKTSIYAQNIGPRLDGQNIYSVDRMPRLNRDDVVLYHMSTGTALNYKICELPCKKVMIYHNITPPDFFVGYSSLSAKRSAAGLKELEFMSDKMDYCIADSAFNKQELEEVGFQCAIDVVPILIPFKDYMQKPDHGVIKKYNSTAVNFIFVGRIAPNKKQENVIKSFYYYKKHFNPKANLFLVGSYGGMERYYNKLRTYIEELQLKDVYFTGHIKFSEILSYYKIADAFVCMSEHEGFCVPLVEAMLFGVPIIAYNSTAIPYTLNGSGVELHENDPILAAEWMDRVVVDKKLKGFLIDGQEKRLKAFDYDVIRSTLIHCLNNFLGENERDEKKENRIH